MNWTRIATFVLGWLVGVLTPLLIELLRRTLFGRPKLRLSVSLVPTEPEYAQTGDVLFCVDAVNVSDVPIILTYASFMIRHGQEAVGSFEEQLPLGRDANKFPMRLARHEDYSQSVLIGEWICDFLECRLAFYEEDSELDYSKLSFDVTLTDTTRRTWRSKPVKLGEWTDLARRQVRVLSRDLEQVCPVEHAHQADAPHRQASR